MLITPSRLPLAVLAGVGVLVLLIGASLAIGSFPVAPRELASVLWSALAGGEAAASDSARAVVLEIRGPRIVAALAVGAALGIAGAAFQVVFRNPLVSPDILGVSSGCALGAVIGIVLGLPAVALQASAFAGGVAAAALVLAIGARIRGADPVLTLVLTGVVVGSLFGAGVAFAKTIADPYQQLPAITFWLLGSFAGVTGADLAIAVPLMVAGALPLALLRWRLNVLALSDDDAASLGIDVSRLRLVAVAAATLATSAAVAIVGIIGWIGLVIPHAARLLAGPALARVLPLAAILGAATLLVVDTVCRTAVQGELPPGVITALLGTPAFIALLAAAARRP